MNLWKIFLIVFIAELPCVVRTIGLQMYSGDMTKVIIGTVAGNMIALVAGILIAKAAMMHFDLKNFAYMDWLTGGLFILLGLYIIFFGE
tara:strand:+ start:5107 stop:5373 length:267 start_codon:yes stop_codon:yes gene_type:complete